MNHLVKMPLATFIAEHKRLIKMLKSGNKPMKKEAKKQEKELEGYLKKRRL